ncbi:MAG: hypothetical protein GXP62_05985 [Oligoflexia bacterium]|nr:hypothetical protein [Oligoflexia bacterium]
MNTIKPKLVLLAPSMLFLLATGCALSDADFSATSALTAVGLTASSDRLDEQLSDVEVTLQLGYTSNEQVAVKILDGDVTLYSESLAASDANLVVSQTVPLLFPDSNLITVSATYFGQTIEQSVEVVQNPSLISVDAATSSDLLTQRQSILSSNIVLGYLSASPVQARILDNDVPVWTGNLDASRITELVVEQTVPLLFPGSNVLIVEATRDGQTLRASSELVVPEPLLALAATPATETPGELAVDVSGTATLGYISDGAASLSLRVDGQVAHTESLDASLGTDLSFSTTLPLRHEGVSTIDATLSYDGGTRTDSFTVDVPTGLQSFALVAADSVASSLAIGVTGSATLGYLSDQPAQAELYVDGALAWSDSFDASTDTAVSFDTTLPLPGEGEHEIVGVMHYGEVQLQDATPVTVPPGIGAFALSAAASDVDVYQVEITASATLGYLSDTTGTLEITVEGVPVLTMDIDGSADTAQAFSATLPLQREGSNDVVATLRYGEELSTQTFTVTVTPPDASVSMPTWSSSYTAGVGTTVSGNVSVSSHASWPVSSVDYSTDGGATWTAASDLGSGQYGVSVVDPDINDTTILFDVETSNDGHPHTSLASDSFSVDPQFDCTSPSASMLPDNNMIQNNKTEARTMVGYWGDPAAGHTVTFVMTADVDGDTYINSAETTHLGVLDVQAIFNVEKIKCESDTCRYDLDVYVDGGLLCSKSNFGEVVKY